MTKFQNAASAGRQLADLLKKSLDTGASLECGPQMTRKRSDFISVSSVARPVSSDSIVMAIVSGGVYVGAAVARELKLPLELLLTRRLMAPFGPQRVLCATSVAGTMVVDDEVAQLPRSPGMDHAIADGINQLSERERFCRAGRPSVDISTKQVILVDNGIHTGSTMQAAIRAVRKLEAKKVIAAVPASALNSRAVIERDADEVFCLEWLENFGHVGLWYKEFVRPTNDQILSVYLNCEENIND